MKLNLTDKIQHLLPILVFCVGISPVVILNYSVVILNIMDQRLGHFCQEEDFIELKLAIFIQIKM